MKAILISIKPEWVCKILNGEKTIEVRKTAPKCELPIEVYIYCTKGKLNLWLPYDFGIYKTSQPYLSDKPLYEIDDKMNGKVVAKFTLRKVGYAWHISDLEIFDEPMKLNGKAPQSWKYIEVE